MGQACVHNKTVKHNGITLLYDVLSLFRECTVSPSVGAALFIIAVYISFKGAQALSRGTYTITPSYTRFFRDFRAVVDRVRSLKSCREILRAKRFKYNVIQGYNIKRNLIASSFNDSAFMSIISTGRSHRVVEAPPQAITAHFKAFFNRPCIPTPIDLDFL